MNPDRADVLLQRFAAAALLRGFQCETIACAGTDPLQIWTRRASSPQAPAVFLSTGIHGDERCAPEALVQLLTLQDLPAQCDWIASPLLNPAGYRLGSRDNGAGIDLNRDFLRRQTQGVRALTDWWLRQTKPCHLHLSLHEDWEAEGFYLYEIDTSGQRPSLAPAILERVASEVALQESGPVDGHGLTAPGLIVHSPDPDDCEGWPEAIWLARTWPLQSYTFEAPGRFPPARRIHALVLACQAAILAFSACKC